MVHVLIFSFFKIMFRFIDLEYAGCIWQSSSRSTQVVNCVIGQPCESEIHGFMELHDSKVFSRNVTSLWSQVTNIDFKNIPVLEYTHLPIRLYFSNNISLIKFKRIDIGFTGKFYEIRQIHLGRMCLRRGSTGKFAPTVILQYYNTKLEQYHGTTSIQSTAVYTHVLSS